MVTGVKALCGVETVNYCNPQLTIIVDYCGITTGLWSRGGSAVHPSAASTGQGTAWGRRQRRLGDLASSGIRIMSALEALNSRSLQWLSKRSTLARPDHRGSVPYEDIFVGYLIVFTLQQSGAAVVLRWLVCIHPRRVRSQVANFSGVNIWHSADKHVRPFNSCCDHSTVVVVGDKPTIKKRSVEKDSSVRDCVAKLLCRME